MKEANIHFQIACPIMKQNRDTFVDVVRWGKKNDIIVVTDYVVFGSYDGTNLNIVDTRLSLDDIKYIIDKYASNKFLENLFKKARIKEQRYMNMPMCSILQNDFCISSKGTVYPCAGWQSCELGNVHQTALKDIWTNSVKIKKIREVKIRVDVPFVWIEGIVMFV